MYSWVIYIFTAVGAVVVGLVMGIPVGRLYGHLSHEARTKAKRIEFISMIAAILAAAVAAGGLAYTVFQIDALTDRISTLEKAARTKPSGAQNPSGQDRL